MDRVDIFVGSSTIQLSPAPIPSEWVLQGTPQARVRVVATSDDNTAMTIVWDCSAGTFNWFYNLDETVSVVEGGMSLTDHSGTREVVAGDVVYFPAGSQATWKVDRYIRKVAFIRQPIPGSVSLALKVWRKLTQPRKAGGFVIVRPTPIPAMAAE